ncbi:MAG: hypothetical protein HUJ91_05660 [Bacteroidales bacterium]|nr:hypothetical protein [Bacteroidales bacterium]
MKNYLKTNKLLAALAISSVVAFSCTVDPHPSLVTLSFENGLSSQIEIVAEDSSNRTFFNLSIPSGESKIVSNEANSWDDLFYPERINSIRVIFSDGKEYLSNDYHSLQSLLNEETYTNKGNCYSVVINEEFYLSAK